ELVIEQVEREIGSGSVIRGLSAVAERVLGIPSGVVRVVSLSTASAPFDSGVFGSRTVGALGRAVGEASNTLASTIGVRLGGSAPGRLELRAGVLFATSDSRSAPIDELLTPEERSGGGLLAEGRHYGWGGAIDVDRVVDGTFYPYTDFASAVHVAEVAVDPETGQVRPIRYAAFHDVGVVVDEATMRGQVEGGVTMGLGAALTEESLWSAEGRLLNPGLLDYRIPTLGEVPPIEVVAVEGFPGAGPFGAKGLGEPPIIPVPAAIANAIADATGSRLTELPATPERVARALKSV
ncbi:MAG: molybdopterin-dependent oxidoreductase, partial [Thermoplasmata archaeon]|nr:molybdopterin-dependent oxidoreductase [Thermoplasmata archaeon]